MPADQAAPHDRPSPTELDRTDPLARFRDEFVTDDVLYLDGNSLGRLPHRTRRRLQDVIAEGWGRGLVGSWDHWIDLSTQVGDRLGDALLGTPAGTTVVCDSVTVNLHKLATAALDAQRGRVDVVTDAGNFPTDRYVLDEVARRAGGHLRAVPTDPITGPEPGQVSSALDDAVGLVSLSHVDYRSGALADIAALTEQAHAAGALVLWDLSHSVGAVPIDLVAAGAGMAVGCTYKYLNAGPGAPGFLYVAQDLAGRLRSPIPGWFGTTDQFAMAAEHQPRPGAARFLTGTPSVPGLVAVDAGVEILAEAGMAELRAKSLALTDLLIELASASLAPLGFGVSTPTDPNRRGGHISLSHPEARSISVAARGRNVVGDFRAPDLLRLAPVPLYTRFGDVALAVERLADLVASGEHRHVAVTGSTVT